MNLYALLVAFIAILIIHYGVKGSNKIDSSLGRGLAKLTAIIAGFFSIALLSFDINTSVLAGRYFFFICVGYSLLYFFYIKKRREVQKKDLNPEQ